MDPESDTVCGLLLAVSTNDRVALRAPVAVGLNTTLTPQLAEAPRLAPQVLVEIEKSLGLVPPMLMLLIVIADLVPLLNVAVCAELVEPTFVGGKEFIGDTVTLPPVVLPPVPDRAAVCGLLLAVSDTVNVAERAPVVAGLNVTLIVQLADGARLLGQLLAVKSPGFVPVMATLLIVIAVALPLVTVAVFAALVEPTFTVPNESDVGLMLTVPEPPVPNPVRGTFCGLVLSESLKLSVAVRVPLTVGAKMILAVQLAPAPREEPQVVEKILKSPGFVPERVLPLIVIAVEFPFVSVTTF